MTRANAPAGSSALLAEDPARRTVEAEVTELETPRRARWGVERAALWVSAVVAVLTVVVAGLDLSVPGRTLLALLFTLLVPGVPLASLLRVPYALLSSCLAVALSLGVALVTAAVEVTTGWWGPTAWATGIAVVSLLLTVVALRRHPADEPGARPAPSLRSRLATPDRLVSAGLLVLALLSWWLATRWLELDAAGATGVLGVLSWAYVLALVLTAVVAARQLLRPTVDSVVLAAAAVVLCIVVFGYTNVGDGEAGVSVGWLHVGFIRFITENHASFLGLDARAYWPGFFGAGADLVDLAGVRDASTFLALSPAVFNIAAIAPVLIIARCITRSSRLAWLAVFVYLSANWYQQDYFSPQATALYLYLTMLALLLWMATQARPTPLAGGWAARSRSAWRRRPALPDGVSTGRALAWEVALLGIAVAIVVSHQLTPATLVFALLVFAVTGHTRYRRLWLLVALVFLLWFSYRASGYWIGNLSTVLDDLGQLNSNLDSAVGGRVSLTADPTYQTMQTVRLAWSFLYALAGLAGWWLIRHRSGAPLFAGLTMAAGALVLFGSYGGEIVLRSFVFAAPLLAPLAAVALGALARLLRLPRLALRRTALAVALLTVALTVGSLLLTTTRGLNIAFERVTTGDVAAANALFDRLQPGDVVGTPASTGALGANRVGELVPLLMSEAGCEAADAVQCAVTEEPEFVVVSRTQDEVGQLTEGRPAGWTTAIADELVDRGLYTVVYADDDATVLQAVGQGG
ncbi:serine/threonine protein kinase [Modestobacter excelsi]|uniref:serine/threonine protein kinase n=1 Tax=Modestobacter excelsi TaxID=2213161 RepID=UPI00110D1DBB|nr:serine/threonine protein kinase [Modestobacter excelsi]